MRVDTNFTSLSHFVGFTFCEFVTFSWFVIKVINGQVANTYPVALAIAAVYSKQILYLSISSAAIQQMSAIADEIAFLDC